MRELTPTEIQTVADELKALAIYNDYIEFMQKYFGPKAVTIKATSDFESNDEGGSYARMDSVTVLDADGSAMLPDVTLPAWQPEQLKADCSYWYGEFPKTEDEAEEALRSVWDNLTPPQEYEDTYTLGQPPTQTFGKVYVDA